MPTRLVMGQARLRWTVDNDVSVSSDMKDLSMTADLLKGEADNEDHDNFLINPSPSKLPKNWRQVRLDLAPGLNFLAGQRFSLLLTSLLDFDGAGDFGGMFVQAVDKVQKPSMLISLGSQDEYSTHYEWTVALEPESFYRAFTLRDTSWNSSTQSVEAHKVTNHLIVDSVAKEEGGLWVTISFQAGPDFNLKWFLLGTILYYGSAKADEDPSREDDEVSLSDSWFGDI